MKTKFLAVIACIFGIILQLRSQGYLVPNGVTTYPSGDIFGSSIHVIQNPANGDYTGFTLQPRGGDTFRFNPFLDEGVRTFLVSYNDPISLEPILSQSYTELLWPNNYVFNNGVPFYVGLYTGASFPVNGIYSDPLFGWAELWNNNGVIEMIDSALEYGGAGIYAGTQTIIPEPTTLALAGLGLAALMTHRRKHA